MCKAHGTCFSGSGRSLFRAQRSMGNGPSRRGVEAAHISAASRAAIWLPHQVSNPHLAHAFSPVSLFGRVHHFAFEIGWPEPFSGPSFLHINHIDFPFYLFSTFLSSSCILVLVSPFKQVGEGRNTLSPVSLIWTAHGREH